MAVGRVVVCDESYPMDLVQSLVPSAERGTVATAPLDATVLLVSPDSPVGAEDFARLPQLGLVATASTGFDHIDLVAAEEADVEVRPAGAYSTDEVADHSIALLISGIRGIPWAIADVGKGGWYYKAGGVARQIRGTRLAIVGHGRIGQATQDRAEALGMEVRWHDPFDASGEPHLDPLLEWADAVSLHLALSERTARIIDRRRLDLLRPGAVLVNTARASLVDRSALIASTHVRALFDHVWEMPPGPDLRAVPHLVITPYMAWYSNVSENLPYQRAAEAAAEYLARD